MLTLDRQQLASLKLPHREIRSSAVTVIGAMYLFQDKGALENGYDIHTPSCWSLVNTK
jgi:hypothetical protein